MSAAAARIREALAEERFEDLFVDELGWDSTAGTQTAVSVGSNTFEIREIARKEGFTVFLHEGPLLAYPNRQSLDRQIARIAAEHFLIFVEPTGGQHWQWTEVRAGRASRLVVHHYRPGERNAGLIARLEEIKFALEEEGQLSVLGVSRRVEGAFRAEEVTGRFYERFKGERDGLVQAIQGLEVDSDREWYASLLMNRLMFLYFLQKREFLDGDRDYLRSRFERIQELRGPDRFHSFFRDFLIPLCHNSLGRDDLQFEDEELSDLVGDVPYVNGGIFAQTGLEAECEIDVPDNVFGQIFDFFDEFRWHLDEGPGAEPNEIDPDVLGYVFEKYVNQKETGAYYTKVDVTRFMVTSALVPVFLERLLKKASNQGIEFNPFGLLTEYPERYIKSSLEKGMGSAVPEEFRSAFAEDPGDAVLSRQASDAAGLPGETWREVLYRHLRYEELLSKLQSGEVSDLDTALTLNLDLRRFAIDAILGADSPDLARLAFDSLRQLTILDPACGSGAFLFAALDLLEDLYDACLTALEGVTSDDSAESEPVLVEVGEHPSRAYFIAKTAALNNLFGVDIMPEAVEIAKLRLFLKLVSEIQHRSDLEPLPDLDFNVRAGNSLVGFHTAEEAVERLEQNLLSLGRTDEINELAREAEHAFEQFVAVQSDGGGFAQVSQARSTLLAAQKELRDGLDGALAESRSIQPAEFPDWQQRERPFHWFAEFNQALRKGGFDVVVGNPPYVGIEEVRSQYPVSGFVTDACPDVFAPMMERASQLVGPSGRLAFIVPLALMFSRQYIPLRSFLEERFENRWASSFGRNPAALFDGSVGVRPTIFIGAPGIESRLFSSRTHRWFEDYRPALFETLRYAEIPSEFCHRSWPKTDDPRLLEMMSVLSESPAIAEATGRGYESRVGHKLTALYVISAYLNEPPCFDADGSPIDQPMARWIGFRERRDANVAFLLFAGKLMLVWWAIWGDDFHVTGEVLESFPFDLVDLDREQEGSLQAMAEELDQAMQSVVDMTPYARRLTGNYALNELRDLTDKSDLFLAEHLGISEFWPAIQLLYDHLMKKTGERPGVFRLDPNVPIEQQGLST